MPTRAFGRILLMGPVLVALLILVSLHHARAEAPGCRAADGWSRLVSRQEHRSAEDVAPPWERERLLNNGGLRQWLFSIAVGWEEQDVIYVGGQNGIYRSTDCGGTWHDPRAPFSAEYGPDVLSFVQDLHVSRTGRLMASVSQGVVASDNFGINWYEARHLGRPLGLGLSPSNPDVAYVFGWDNGFSSGSHDATRTVLRTVDGGRTWETRLRRGKPRGANVVDPTDPSVVYVIGDGVVHRSTDGALTFEKMRSYDPGASAEAVAQGRNWTGRAAMSVDGSRLWFITVEGTFYQSFDRGWTWQRLVSVPFSGTVTSVSASPHDPRTLYALARGDEIWMYREPSDAHPDDPRQTAR